MLAEELGGTSPETSWPERFHHLQMKCMTPSVAASQCSSGAALARGLRVDVILPVETHPKNIVQDRVEPLRASSAPPDLIFSGTCHISESRSRSGTLEGPGGVTGGVCARSAGAFTADGLCQGASAPMPGFPSAVFTSWQRGKALLTSAVRWVRRGGWCLYIILAIS